MGENLALNIERNGFPILSTIAPRKTEAFMASEPGNKLNHLPIEDFVALERPAKS